MDGRVAGGTKGDLGKEEEEEKKRVDVVRVEYILI